MLEKKKIWIMLVILLTVNVLVIAGIVHITNEKRDEAYAYVAQPDLTENMRVQVIEELESLDAEELDINESELENEYLRVPEPSESYANIYGAILVGEYISDDGTAFKFNESGSFSGYFDEENTDVENYSYQIFSENETDNLLIIYSADKRKEARYVISIDMNGDIVLIVPDTEVKYVLCYDGMLYKENEKTGTDASEQVPDGNITDNENETNS